MKKTFKTIISAILLALLVAIAGISIYSNIQKAKGNTLPMPLGIGTAVPETGSMEPNMPIGSYVVLVRSRTYKIGDVVAFQKTGDDIHTVHRIVEIDGDTVITCGDANNGSNDEPITMDRIKGKMLFNIPKLGFTLQKISNVISHPASIIIILLLVAVTLFFSFKTDSNDKKEQSIDEIKAEIEKLKQEDKD